MDWPTWTATWEHVDKEDDDVVMTLLDLDILDILKVLVVIKTGPVIEPLRDLVHWFIDLIG